MRWGWSKWQSKLSMPVSVHCGGRGCIVEAQGPSTSLGMTGLGWGRAKRNYNTVISSEWRVRLRTSCGVERPCVYFSTQNQTHGPSTTLGMTDLGWGWRTEPKANARSLDFARDDRDGWVQAKRNYNTVISSGAARPQRGRAAESRDLAVTALPENQTQGPSASLGMTNLGWG